MQEVSSLNYFGHIVLCQESPSILNTKTANRKLQQAKFSADKYVDTLKLQPYMEEVQVDCGKTKCLSHIFLTQIFSCLQLINFSLHVNLYSYKCSWSQVLFPGPGFGDVRHFGTRISADVCAGFSPLTRSGVLRSTARITAALCDVTSDISEKTSDKSVLILVSNSQTPGSSLRRRRMRPKKSCGSRVNKKPASHQRSIQADRLAFLKNNKIISKMAASEGATLHLISQGSRWKQNGD